MLERVKGGFLTWIALKCARLNMAISIIPIRTLLRMKSVNLKYCNNAVHKPVNIIRTRDCKKKSASKFLECRIEGWWNFVHLNVFHIKL